MSPSAEPTKVAAEETATPTGDATAAAAAAAPIDLSGDGGCLKQLTHASTAGPETPGDGCTVSCHYTGTLADGTQFDSSVGREPFGFELGKGAVVKGFELAAASMRRGERATFTFAPAYGYGAHGSPPTIPGGATLQFAMEMLGWTAPDCSPNRDGGIERHVLVKSARPKKTPTDGATVTVDLVGRHGDRVFDERAGLVFRVGERPHAEVAEGVQIGVLHMGRGEQSRFVVQPRYAFGARGSERFAVPPNATVEYTVTLQQFDNEQVAWQLDETESVEQAKVYKERGTEQFRAGEWRLAVKLYEKANGFLSNCPTDGTNAEAAQLKVAALLNVALCQQKLDDGAAVKTACNAVLELEPDNVKALYRRGQARLSAGETEEALADFGRCVQLDPRNGAAAQQVAECKRLQAAAYEKDKQLYRNMFSKFASKDNEKEESVRSEVDVLSACGEWNAEEAATKEAELAFKEVDENVVMI